MLRNGNKTVPVSQTAALASFNRLRSHTVSAGDHGQSSRENIGSCVDVAVMSGAARPTTPEAHVEWHGIRHYPARRTGLARRIPAVYADEPSPIPAALVFEHSRKLTPTGIADRSGQSVVRHHAAHVQVFDRDRLVFTNQTGRKLVQIVAANIRNPLVDLGHPELCLALVLRALPLAGQRLLRPLQLRHLAAQRSRRWMLAAIREGGEAGQSQINADLPGSRGHHRQRFIHAERNVVASSGRAAYVDCSRLSRESARPADIQIANLGERQCRSVPLETRARELRRLFAVALLEVGVRRAILPEVDERGLQVAQGLLDRDALGSRLVRN